MLKRKMFRIKAETNQKNPMLKVIHGTGAKFKVLMHVVAFLAPCRAVSTRRTWDPGAFDFDYFDLECVDSIFHLCKVSFDSCTLLHLLFGIDSYRFLSAAIWLDLDRRPREKARAVPQYKEAPDDL